ncbi:phosphoribosyl transferase [Candidatus Uhrbacteria bacterium]|nr:phosphoribosyl transferase [Candidatus Uhrbacteria bacterium]
MFKDRKEAGEKLAQALVKYKNAPETIVLALPRGGVVVGFEVARALRLPLDIVVPRKIGAPGNPEYAIGAITETGDAMMNDEEVRQVDKEWLKQEMEKEKKEAERRLTAYRAGSPPRIEGKTVIIVDDGMATGYTMRAAVASVRARKAAKIIVAIPHGAGDSIEQIRREVDEVAALEIPAVYFAVGAHYEEFPQISDAEVISLLRASQTIESPK